MQALGLHSYRFSVSWSRVLPAGRGTVNQKGLDFYSRLIDELLGRGIAPNVTLYHWDLPAALDDRGGWLNADIADWFADYSTLMFRALGDRVETWATLNEPWVVMDAGYVHGVHAPGRCDWRVAPRVAHNLLRAHGSAVQAFRAESKARIGIVVNLEPQYAASDSAADLAATERAHAYFNGQFLDPILLGSHPAELIEIYDDAWIEHPSSDLVLISEPIDYVGINYYKRSVTCADADAQPVRAGTVPQPQHVHTDLGWEVYPPGLTRILTWFHERYGDVAVYITENGAVFADPDAVPADGINDTARLAYIANHLLAAHDAIALGVNLRGYYVWSLLDNFEWAEGYTRRFGIVHVDFATLERTPKASARFYSDVIRSNGSAIADTRG